MGDGEARDRLRAALGEPRNAEAAARRLEAWLCAVPAGEAATASERRQPPSTTALAAALAAVVVVGLLALHAAKPRVPTPARPTVPAAGSSVLPAPTGCPPGAPGRLVVIHLTTQQLVAYQDGCTLLVTSVTTGQPALPTETGTFHVLVKRPVWRMTSPYPPDSPHWYPTTTVHDYVAVGADGLSLHSAEWEPDAAFGPGSEEGPYATDGSVNVPSGPLQRLYDWLDVGTPVLIEP